ncbi:MAG: hypothetical protein QMD11_11120, partial [Smithella sp.]|nr:hypothetical protein [Smithella sp.]
MKKRVSAESVIISIRRIMEINIINEKSLAPVITACVIIVFFASFLFVVGEKTLAFYVGGGIVTVLLLLFALSLHPQIFPHFGVYPPNLIVDAVYDEGSSILLEYKGKSVRVNLTDIKSICMHLGMKDVTIDVKDIRPLRFPTLILCLLYKTEFGDEVTFIGDVDRIKGGYSKDLQDLINRIE